MFLQGHAVQKELCQHQPLQGVAKWQHGVVAEHFVYLKAIRFVSGSIKIRVNFGPRPFTGAQLGLKLSFVRQRY